MLVFNASAGAVLSLCFTPDGRGLVTGAHGGAALWDVTGVPQFVRVFIQTGYGCPVAVSPDGRFVACGGNTLRVSDLTAPSRNEWVGEGSATAVAFAPDGTEFAAPAYHPRQWAVPSWGVIRADPAVQNPDRSEFCTGALAYTPDGNALGVSFAVLSEDRSRYDSAVVLFDRATGARTGVLKMVFQYAHPTQIAFRPDGKVVAGNFGPVLGVVSVADGAEVARIKVGTKHITGLAFTPDGAKLVAVSNDTRVRVYDAHTWQETEGYEWKIGKLRSVAVAPDGLRMAAGSASGKVVMWDVG